MDGESPRSGSNQGSVAHLSEVNQESITSRGKGPYIWLEIKLKLACVVESNNDYSKAKNRNGYTTYYKVEWDITVVEELLRLK